jgi:hypothetical protein
MKYVVRLLASVVLLSLFVVLLVSILSAGPHNHHRPSSHHLAKATMAPGHGDPLTARHHGAQPPAHHNNCPFMHHGESLCPMTTLDHIAVLRTIFESTLPAVVALTLIIGSVGVIAVTLVRLLPRSQSTHTFFRWRQAVTYSFVYRFYQSLLARGIMQPKVFA